MKYWNYELDFQVLCTEQNMSNVCVNFIVQHFSFIPFPSSKITALTADYFTDVLNGIFQMYVVDIN